MRLIDEKEHEIGAGDRVGEASEHVDDDKRDEKRRAVHGGGQEAPRCRGKARPTDQGGDEKPPFGESPLVDQDCCFLYLTLDGFIDYCAAVVWLAVLGGEIGSGGTISVFRHFMLVAGSFARRPSPT